MNSRKIDYNRRTSKDWGWLPVWFGAFTFDEELIDKVRLFQLQHDLVADGLVGSMTFRRIWAQRESQISDWAPYGPATPKGGDYIIHNGHHLPIGCNVVDWTEHDQGGARLPEGCFTNMAATTAPRDIRMLVAHWDVCLSSGSCFNVLSKRGVSVHFGIDNDGTLYQWLDMDHVAWHASDRDTNRCSVGVEISNAFYPKYQDWYVGHGFGERPLVEGAKVHGCTMKPHLGFYPAQMVTLGKLITALNHGLGIPLVTPDVDGVVPSVGAGTFRGFVNHYHVLRGKIDCGGETLPEVSRVAA